MSGAARPTKALSSAGSYSAAAARRWCWSKTHVRSMKKHCFDCMGELQMIIKLKSWFKSMRRNAHGVNNLSSL